MKIWEQMYGLAATLKSLGRGIYFLSFKNVAFIKGRAVGEQYICRENPASQNPNNTKHSLLMKL